jgi:hypothetical protein
MAYNEKLADRIREMIALTHKKVQEKKMFGGLCFMVNDRMWVGVGQKLKYRVNLALEYNKVAKASKKKKTK